ncbi:MAG: hypothetical protein K2F94_10610, partial [Muribaculaceae bacterium]|nr:hypothetical protein [Muribaculaceae bacterium]
MKSIENMKRIILISGAAMLVVPVFGVTPEEVEIENSLALPVSDKMKFSADIVLDAVKVGANRQLYITPVIGDGEGNTRAFPSVLVNGRSMQ